MTPEEQAAADAAAAVSAGAADAGAGEQEQTPGYWKAWKAEAKKAAEKLKTLKAEVAEGNVAKERLKEIEDATKTETQRLTEANAALSGKAARADALEAEVQAILDEATAELTDAQKAVIVGDTPEAKLKHYRSLVAAGMLGKGDPGRDIGGELPGKGTAGSTIKQAAWDKLGPAERMKLSLKGVRVV